MEPHLEAFSDLIRVNQNFARTFDLAGLGSKPASQIAIVTCMDCRIDTTEAFGMAPGEGHVMRNAGARVSDDMLRSLIKSTHQLGVNRIAVIHHTGCGASLIKLDVLRDTVKASTGNDPADVDFMLIDSEPDALIEDLERLRTSPYLPPGTDIAGFIYDVDTGKLAPVASGKVGTDPVVPAQS